ncbi:MAG: amidohydrolase family protein [Burkholderiales bacterium]|nr:amidohydrolase family protein [Burkholderiales bacterium]
MSASRSPLLLRGARALLGESFSLSDPLDVAIDGGRIAAIGPAGSLPAQATTILLERRLLAPGMVNGHFHSHEHFQRGRHENLPLELWMHNVRPVRPVPLTPRDAYLRTMIGAIECLRSGATTVVDDLTLGAAIDRPLLDAVFQAYEDAGVRALVGFAMMDRAVIDNFPYVDACADAETLARLRALPRPSPEAFHGLVRELARSRHPQSNRVGVLVSCSAPQRCTEGFLRASRRLADDLDLPVITHVQETRMQVVTGQSFYGHTMVEHLHAVGFLKDKTTLIHGVWLNPREIELLARAGTTVQHNPWSNLMLGSGVAPVRELLRSGVNVGMGTDGMSSTVTANMLTTVGSAAALSKLRGEDADWLSAREALSIATAGGARAFGFGDRLGRIEVGAIADLCAWRLDTIAFTPLADPVRQLVYGERGAGLDMVLVDGEPVMRDGRLVRVDEGALLDEISSAVERLAPEFALAEASVTDIHRVMRAVLARCAAQPLAADTYPARL